SVVITGAGTMGLLLLQLLVRAGADRIAVIDPIAARLHVPRTLGAEETVTSAADLDGARFAIAVDATGVPAAIESILDLLDPGGRLLVFGVAPAPARVAGSPV